MAKVGFILIVICFYKWTKNWNKIFYCHLLQIWDVFLLKRNSIKALHGNQANQVYYHLLNRSSKIYHIEPRQESRSSIISFEEDTHKTIQTSLLTHNHDQSTKVSPYILELISNIQPSLNELDHPQINPKTPNLS